MNEQNSSKSVNNWMLRQDLILVMLKKKMQPDIRLWFIVQWEDFQNIFGHVFQLFLYRSFCMIEKFLYENIKKIPIGMFFDLHAKLEIDTVKFEITIVDSDLYRVTVFKLAKYTV